MNVSMLLGVTLYAERINNRALTEFRELLAFQHATRSCR